MSVKGSSSGHHELKGSSSTENLPLVGNLHKALKVSTPDTYSGERSKLKGFLIQVDLYLTFNSTRFNSETERVLWVVSFLRGDALNWIEGFVIDYMHKTNDRGQIMNNMREETKALFRTYKGFIDKITATFGAVDEEKQAERAIQTLRQRGSCATYTAEFQRYSSKTGWNDDALRAQYYRGLKDSVKDELVKDEKPDTMADMIEMATKIDNRLYERALEKKGFYDTGHRQNQRTPRQQNHWPQPMELDATEKREMSPQVRQKHMQDRTCFNCGKPGHLARNCKGKGRPRQHAGKRGELNATGRGGYNGAMQLNATLQGLEDTSQWEGSQGFEVVNYEEEVTESSSDESSFISEITETEYMKIQILSGTKTAQTLDEANAQRFHEKQKQIEKEYDEGPQTYDRVLQAVRTGFGLLLERKTFVYNLGQAIAKQIREATDAEGLTIKRSQQYQDRLSMNIDYQSYLEAEETRLRKEKEEIQAEIETLRREENVARIDHPRHRELAWSACYTDSCEVHYSSKEGSGYWPRTKTPVYWPGASENLGNRALVLRTKPAKN
jgi:hypothetical protein